MMMGEPREPPNYEDVIQAFLSWVDGVHSVEVIDPDTSLMRPFVVADDMRKYFEDDDHRRLKKIISVHFEDPSSLWVDDVVPDNVAVFCTLLSISKGSYIKIFRHHDALNDAALPFDPTRPPQNWPQGADFLPQFCEAQWKFCAPVLRAPFKGKRYAKDMVLPIVFKKSLHTEGSSASLWLIKIHPSYNQLISEADKKKLGDHANTFVMKSYFTSEAEKYYDTEVEAFRHLGLNPSIIKFHGSFARGDSYNVLLEYADKGSLAEYFKNESPPSEGIEIIRFWEAMFNLIDALRRIHDVGGDDSDGPRILQGRHQDVKPDNVLIISNGSENRADWTFKLADLGMSKFKGRMPRRQDSTDKNARGTRTYGAPESYRPDGTYEHDSLREGRNSDIWSLGCIYSEASRWLKDGHRGIQAYRQERQEETSQIQGFRDGDCFHDGEKMLICVRQCHKYSVRNLRSEDFITKDVVDVLISDMLGMAEARSTSFTLYQKSKQLIKTAKGDLDAAIIEPKTCSSPTSPKRPRTRSFTAPNHDFRLPAPPNPPPGVFPVISLHTAHQNTNFFTSQNVSPNNNSPPHILDPSDSTSELEGVENLRFSPTSRVKSHSPRELSHQIPQSHPTITYDKLEDIGSISNVTNGERPESSMTWARASAHEATILGPASSRFQHTPTVLAAASEELYESPSPPRSQSAIPAMLAPYHHPTPSITAEPFTTQRSPSTRHTTTGSVVPQMPLIIQGPPKLPNLSLEDALEWRRKRKGNGPKTPLKDWQYLDRLRDRDHVFLIDDSISMHQHWRNVQKVFETISYLVKEVDPDGFDLWFTGPGKPLKNCRKTTAPLQEVELRRQHGTTDISNKLTLIFEDYIEDLEKPRSGFLTQRLKPVKPLSLYVFTDGVWEKDCNPRNPVENFVRQLESLHKVKGKVGIQFISFGQDPVGLARMELLDSGLNVNLDIVDTEPWNGNVWKILLGAINDSFDRIHDKHGSGENGASSSSNRMSLLAAHPREFS